MLRLLRYPLVALLMLVQAGPALAQSDVLEQLGEVAHIDQKVMMPMRDGVRLATDIFRPRTDEPVPIVFSRTPYNFNSWGDGEMRTRAYSTALRWVNAGYAYVVQNERGRYFSEGEWDILGTPLTDAEDAFTWMADQSWSNGRIGLYGCSSTAEWQMAAASLDHPALAAIVPQGFGAGVGRVGGWYEQGNWYRGGAQQMLFTAWLYGVQDIQRPTFSEDLTQEDLIRVSRFYDLAAEKPSVDWSSALRHLPVRDILSNVDGPKGVYERMIAREPNDPAWYEGGLYHDDMPIDVPGYWFVSWYDVSQGPNLALYDHVRNTSEAGDDQYLVIAPTTHCGFTRASEHTMVGDLDVGDARLDYQGMLTGWFDRWLKGEENGFEAETPRVQYYTMGENAWNASDSWPPAAAETLTLYLDSEGSANSVFGDGRLVAEPPRRDRADSYSYDPAFPVPSLGGQVCCTGNAVRGGAMDQRQMEARNDILVYTSDVFEEGVEVTGWIDVTLFVSSDARDTDFTVKLVDVYPDGRAFNIDETIQRARWREGYEEPVFMEEGEIYEIKLGPMVTSNLFAPGHRIRVEVSSSNFPRFERNLNTGGANFDETEGVVARNVIHHSARYPSRIELSVMPR